MTLQSFELEANSFPSFEKETCSTSSVWRFSTWLSSTGVLRWIHLNSSNQEEGLKTPELPWNLRHDCLWRRSFQSDSSLEIRYQFWQTSLARKTSFKEVSRPKTRSSKQSVRLFQALHDDEDCARDIIFQIGLSDFSLKIFRFELQTFLKSFVAIIISSKLKMYWTEPRRSTG